MISKKELKKIYDDVLAIRNSECREHFEKGEPCSVCSQWNEESSACGLADRLSNLLKKLEVTEND